MHPYSTDEERTKVYSRLAVLAVIVSFLTGYLGGKIGLPAWLAGPPTVAGSYLLLYRLVDNQLWRTWVGRAFGVSVPDISGSYDVQLMSTYEDAPGPYDCRLVVHQKWTTILVQMEVLSGSSTSESVSATASVRSEGTTARLLYTYRNTVNPGIAEADMRDHLGTADLLFRDGRISGRYYNDRPRRGTIRSKESEVSRPGQ